VRAKTSWVAVAAGLVVLAIPAPPSAQAALDANCPPVREATWLFSGFPDSGNVRLAQTFTAQAGGALTMAQVDISKAGTSADWIMSINEVDGSGSPTNTVLASTTILDSWVPDGDGIIAGGFDSPATVVAGQQYALVVTRPGSTSLRLGIRQGDDCPGGHSFWSTNQTGTFMTPGIEPTDDVVFAVHVKPMPTPSDDGGGDSAPPDTTITKGPKDKTKKKTATFEFTGTDARAVASFQCKLDGSAFAGCTSPHTVKVNKGKHTFQVQAIDQAGNVGSPATDTWKRKKRKR
jgi:hypothetical protein